MIDKSLHESRESVDLKSRDAVEREGVRSRDDQHGRRQEERGWLTDRSDAPRLMRELHAFEWLPRSVAIALVCRIWSSSESRDRDISHDDWRELFEFAGYTVDGESAERPSEPLVLWRASVAERRADWSWTDDREVAQHHASGKYERRPERKLWRASVEPWRLLARNTMRDESEYVVDTDGLTIVEDASDQIPDTRRAVAVP